MQEFSTAGAYLAQFGSSGSGNGQFHGLGGIASDPTTGNLYVSDLGNNRVQEFSSAGAFVAAFGSPGSGAGQFSGPRGVAVNSSGTLYVAKPGWRVTWRTRPHGDGIPGGGALTKTTEGGRATRPAGGSRR